MTITPFPEQPPSSRPSGGCATGLIALLGVILLLPGIGSILFGLSMARPAMSHA